MKKSNKPHKTILVGIDYSKSSANAVEYAAMLAEKGKTSLILFHIFDAPVVHTNSGMYFISYKAIQESSETKLENYRDLIKEKYPALSIEILTSSEPFQMQIEDLIRRRRVQYIVLGLETKTRISKFIYGSHSTSIAGKVNCPVIIVPEKYKDHKLTNAVLAIDNVKTANYEIMKKVKDFSSYFKTKVTNVHVRTPEDFFFKNDSRKAKKIKLEVIEARSFPDGISKYSKNKKADLTMIVSQSHSALYNFFNESNTKTIAFQSKIPVMALHN